MNTPEKKPASFDTGGWFLWEKPDGKTVNLQYVAGDWSDSDGILYDKPSLLKEGWRLLG